MSKLQEGSIQDKVSHVLFYSHITPLSTTGVSPAELLQNCRLRSRLDLLRPDIEVKVETKQQSKEQAYMNHNSTICRSGVHKEFWCRFEVGPRTCSIPCRQCFIWCQTLQWSDKSSSH